MKLIARHGRFALFERTAVNPFRGIDQGRALRLVRDDDQREGRDVEAKRVWHFRVVGDRLARSNDTRLLARYRPGILRWVEGVVARQHGDYDKRGRSAADVAG